MKFLQKRRDDKSIDLNLNVVYSDYCGYFVADNKYNRKRDIDFKKEMTGRFELLYPIELGTCLDFEIKYSTLHELIDEIRRCYLFIYADEDNRFGIWGHCIEDLVIEFIEVYDNGDVFVGIGS